MTYNTEFLDIQIGVEQPKTLLEELSSVPAKLHKLNTSSVHSEECNQGSTRDSIVLEDLEDSEYYSACSQDDMHQDLQGGRLHTSRSCAHSPLRRLDSTLQAVPTSTLQVKKVRSHSTGAFHCSELNTRMDPLRKESDGLLVSMMPHIEKPVETRCIEMMNMAQRPHSVCKHNKLHKLRGDRRDRVLKEFERADLSYLEMFDSDRELTFTWEHAYFFLKARQCTEETVLRYIVNKHTSINKNYINNINTFYGKESLVWRLFANDVLKYEEVYDLLKECRTDKQLCLALQYYVDYFYQVVNFDMMVYIVCNEFEAFANHHMANFLVIKLMEKSNPVQQTKLAFQFEAHYARLAFNQFGFIVISKVIENLDIQFTFNLCYALANDAAIFTAAVHNANASLLVQNVLDSQYLQFLSKWNPDYEIGQTHLIEYLTTNVLTVSHTFTGSKVISKCLERIKLAKIEGLLGAILTYFKELSTNEFGNYIIQTIIQRINYSDLKIVTVYISENLVDLSANKFSSYIIETIVRMRNLELNRMLLQVLVESPGKLAVKGRKKTVLDESDPMYKVMQDQFGNYVLKNLYNVLDRDGKRAMYNKAMSLFSTGMCNNYYCKQLIKNIQN